MVIPLPGPLFVGEPGLFSDPIRHINHHLALLLLSVFHHRRPAGRKEGVLTPLWSKKKEEVVQFRRKSVSSHGQFWWPRPSLGNLGRLIGLEILCQFRQHLLYGVGRGVPDVWPDW